MVPYVCPRCRGSLDSTSETYECAGCRVEYPVVAGIPDFRVAADPWIGIREDREKALRLRELTEGLDFEQSVRAYWSITPETPTPLVERFVDHVLTARRRSGEWVSRLREAGETGSGGAWLDIGCGTADLAAALAGEVFEAVGGDIALRWLVVAQKRPEVRTAAVQLVCCCAEALPFADATFERVLSLGLLEHCADPVPVARESSRVLVPGGTVRHRTVNRYTPLAEPHVGLWGVGWVPRNWADRYVAWRSQGQSRYRHHRPISRRELVGALRRAGLGRVRVVAAPVLPAEAAKLGTAARRLAVIYDRVRTLPVVGRGLSWISPVIEGHGSHP